MAWREYNNTESEQNKLKYGNENKRMKIELNRTNDINKTKHAANTIKTRRINTNKSLYGLRNRDKELKIKTQDIFDVWSLNFHIEKI